MKTQKRPFVVERKVGRRRLTTQPTSIWGDTDLKALAQKVEADAPHLFERSIASEPQNLASLRTDPDSETPVSENAEADGNQPSAAMSIEPKQVMVYADDKLASGVAAQLSDASLNEQAPELVKRHRKPNGHYRSHRAESIAAESPTSAQIATHGDELDALDAENRRLKGLLASHLRQQNMQLRAMLGRFGG